MVSARIEAIAGRGGEVVVIDGLATKRPPLRPLVGDVVIADTGAGDAPRWVTEGYSTMPRELGDRTFDAVFTPSSGRARRRRGHRCSAPVPRPLVAVQASGRRACPTPRRRPGGHLPEVPRTIMSGIACGTPSPTAWPLVSRLRLDGDHRGRPGPGRHAGAGPGGHVGRDGVAVLGGLLEVLVGAGEGPELGPDSTVLVLSTEGATDPVAYAAIVGAQAS